MQFLDFFESYVASRVNWINGEVRINIEILISSEESGDYRIGLRLDWLSDVALI